MNEKPAVDRSHIPHACGVYLMRGAGSEILYIGKAKDLSKRIANYFQKQTPDLKRTFLVPLIRRIDYIACSSEKDALILESQLVKKYQPFFNSDLKDDKAYPLIKISMGEDFPRVLFVRRKTKDRGVYFGPFTSVGPVRNFLKYLWRQKYFPLRPCRWDFSFEKPLSPQKINTCLYYHTGQCPAPCAGLIPYDDYRQIAEKLILFLKGDYSTLAGNLNEEMREASKKLEYEKASVLRDMIRGLTEIKDRVRLRELATSDISELLKETDSIRDLKETLHLSKAPFHIECFDISHFQGRQTVASMVCFMGGEPNRSHYRRFKIKTVSGIDDFASMREVVSRRYKRLKSEGGLPDLVLVDGGKGQLQAAKDALKDSGCSLPLAALAKRIEEIFIPESAQSLVLERNRPALRLLQHLRDEAHRFAITYHRLLRKKALFSA